MLGQPSESQSRSGSTLTKVPEVGKVGSYGQLSAIYFACTCSRDSSTAEADVSALIRSSIAFYQ